MTPETMCVCTTRELTMMWYKAEFTSCHVDTGATKTSIPLAHRTVDQRLGKQLSLARKTI